MSCAEFYEWVAIFLSSPFDDERCHDLPAALIRGDARAIAGQKNVDPRRLMPFRDSTPQSFSDWSSQFDAASE